MQLIVDIPRVGRELSTHWRNLNSNSLIADCVAEQVIESMTADDQNGEVGYTIASLEYEYGDINDCTGSDELLYHVLKTIKPHCNVGTLANGRCTGKGTLTFDMVT